jgi:predicted nucleotide-binding protein
MKSPRIAVLGSFYEGKRDDFPFMGTFGEFQAACRSIGALLARLGHTLVVQYDDPRTADTYCVEGYLNQIEQNPKLGDEHSIAVGRPASSFKRHFEQYLYRHPTVFHYERFVSQRWDSARFKSSLESDATLLIGGAGRAEKTGYVVLSAGGLLVPIGSFGGAAEVLLGEVADGVISKRKLPDPLTINVLRRPWSDAMLMSLEVALRSPYRRPRIVIVHGRDEDALNQLTRILDACRIQPEIKVMREVAAVGMTLPETWEQLARSADGAIALTTPDDEGRLRNGASPPAVSLTPRARQNVWLEYGWFWGHLGRERVQLLVRRDVDVRTPEVPTDALGIRYSTWEASVNELVGDIEAFVELVHSQLRAFT